jgi:hypothetical protein
VSFYFRLYLSTRAHTVLVLPHGHNGQEEAAQSARGRNRRAGAWRQSLINWHPHNHQIIQIIFAFGSTSTRSVYLAREFHAMRVLHKDLQEEKPSVEPHCLFFWLLSICALVSADFARQTRGWRFHCTERGAQCVAASCEAARHESGAPLTRYSFTPDNMNSKKCFHVFRVQSCMALVTVMSVSWNSCAKHPGGDGHGRTCVQLARRQTGDAHCDGHGRHCDRCVSSAVPAEKTTYCRVKLNLNKKLNICLGKQIVFRDWSAKKKPKFSSDMWFTYYS